jgi:hypothetical protein
MDRETKNITQINGKNIVSYNKIFEVVWNKESHLTSSPQYTEVYDKAHTLKHFELWILVEHCPSVSAHTQGAPSFH